MTLLESWIHNFIPTEGFDTGDLWQLLLVAVLLILTQKLLGRKPESDPDAPYGLSVWLPEHYSYIAFWLVLLVINITLHLTTEIHPQVLNLFCGLGGTWMLVGSSASCLRKRFWSKSISLIVYSVSIILLFLKVWEDFTIVTDFTFNIGALKLSLWGIVTGIAAFAITLWISLAIAQIAEVQIQKVPRLSPSLKVLLVKIMRIVFIVLAAFIAVSSMGIDLSALTVLGGAVGLGLGFGLQKVVSNFVSGIILLTDNSIKPGDVIEIDGTYGWINNLRARYASVITRDGTEHLIPNEDLITQHVVNWSFTDNLVRLRVPIGVSYKEDPHQCIQLVLEAAQSIERVLRTPPPVCLLRGFGDSSIDLELRFWISDPANGVGNVKSQVLLKVWDAFKEHKIEIPFPQRDLHIRSSEVVPVARTEMSQADADD
ncbi:mechanosensitive ion channel family protein [Coraliomargarita parva]|uniref:mechanosensitive ion channel family protein n=1 Tax=Coraliomargarita parva TaxID=3014050 RepID=UPI0022B59CF8|nr:mechanosensitive ion channel domain-containing protein [Coraliomargarita parva]